MTVQQIKEQIKDINEGLAEFSPSEKEQFGAKLLAKKKELETELSKLESATKQVPKTKPTTPKATAQKVAKQKVVSKAKAKTSKVVAEAKSLLEKLRATKAQKAFNAGKSKEELERDSKREALPIGKRISEDGNVYYEYRSNRADVSTKRKPYLEMGGGVDGNIESLLLVFKIEQDFQNAKEHFYNGSSDFYPYECNDEFKTFYFKVADQDDADSLEFYIEQELQQLDIIGYHFESEDGNEFAKGGEIPFEKEIDEQYLVYSTSDESGYAIDKATGKMIYDIDKNGDKKKYWNSPEEVYEYLSLLISKGQKPNVENDNFKYTKPNYDASTLNLVFQDNENYKIAKDWFLHKSLYRFDESSDEDNTLYFKVGSKDELDRMEKQLKYELEKNRRKQGTYFTNYYFVKDTKMAKGGEIEDEQSFHTGDKVKNKTTGEKAEVIMLNTGGNSLMESYSVRTENGKQCYWWATDMEVCYECGGRMMERGGYIKNQYQGKTAEQVWDEWTIAQRSHFLLDHIGRAKVEPNKDKSFDELSEQIKLDLEFHITEGQYEKGGSIKQYKDLSLEKPLTVNDYRFDNGGVISKVKEVDLVKLGFVTISNRVTQIRNSQDSINVFRDFWNDNSINIQESFNVLLLNKANKPIGIYNLSKGGIDGTVADPELIAAMAVKTLAKGVIICHNHPSGNLQPSKADINISQKIKEGLKLFDISLLDSLIITENSYLSFADDGYLEKGGVTYNTGRSWHQDRAMHNKAESWEKPLSERKESGGEMYAYGGEMKWGGRVTFKEKVEAITKSLNGRKVKPKYKKEYGNTYDKKEAKQAATKIVGAMVSKGKMADGGMMAKGGETPSNVKLTNMLNPLVVIDKPKDINSSKTKKAIEFLILEKNYTPKDIHLRMMYMTDDEGEKTTMNEFRKIKNLVALEKDFKNGRFEKK